MKKLLLTLIVAFAFCGSIFAQESNWPDFNSGPFESYDADVAFVKINGDYVVESNYANIEVAAFVDGEVRGTAFMEFYGDPDPYPILEISIFYDNKNENVSFMMYDHSIGKLYNVCTTNFEVLTGVDHDELYFNYDEALILDFSASTTDYRRTVTGYGEDNPGGYVLLASPINGITPANVTNLVAENEADYDLYAFDQNPEDGDEWRNFKAGAFSTLVSGTGYLYASKETVELVFAGTPYSGDGTFDLVYAGSEFPGMNLMGNPFTEDAYSTLPYYTLNADGEFESHAVSEAIPAMHGVFVCTENEAGETVTFSTEGGKKVSHLALNLVSSTKLVDRAIVNFGEGQLPKFQLNANSTKLYFPMSNKDYAVVSCQEMGELPVNFKAEKSGSYTIAVNSEEVSFAYLHLIDNLSGTDTDLLANPSYSFEASTTDYASRFKLVFATGNTSDEFAFFSNGSFVINNDGNATLQVVDVTGRIVKSESINGCANVSVNAAPGVYMIRLINGDSQKVQKVIVK